MVFRELARGAVRHHVVLYMCILGSQLDVSSRYGRLLVVVVSWMVGGSPLSFLSYTSRARSASVMSSSRRAAGEGVPINGPILRIVSFVNTVVSSPRTDLVALTSRPTACARWSVIPLRLLGDQRTPECCSAKKEAKKRSTVTQASQVVPHPSTD